MNNEDLCVFINVVIKDIEIVFIKGNIFYYCCIVKDCE